MAYQEIFGGSAVWPSNQTYTAITVSSDIALAWPIESVSTNIIIADLIDVTPTTPGGWNVALPDATGGSTGVTMIVNNLSGAFSFNVTDSAGNIVVNAVPGSVWLIYLTDNSTSAGVWEAFQYGAQAGSVNVAAIAGSGLLAIGSSLNQSMPVLSKSTNYTIVNDDRASVILWTGAAGTLTLPTAAGVGSNWFVNIRNSGTADVAVTPPSGTIDGALSKNFAAGSGSAIVFTDGTNYYTLGYGIPPTTAQFDYTTINCAGSDGLTGPVTLSGGQVNRISYKCFGILTGPRTIVVPGSVQQYWINNQTTSSGGPWTLTIKTAGGSGLTVAQPGQAIMYCDGTDMIPGQSGMTLPVTIASGGTGSTTAPAALAALGGSAVGINIFSSSSAAVARGYLQSGATGDAIFLAANPSTALTAMQGGTMTGTLTVTGAFTSGNLRLTAATNPVNGWSLSATNQITAYTNSISALSFTSAQTVVLAHPLDVAYGGTGATNASSARANIGLTTMDNTATPAVSTIVQRNGSGYVYAEFFNQIHAQQNLTISSVFTETANDGFLRKLSLADFRTQMDTGYATAGATGSQTFPSGITIKWSVTGNIATNGSTGGLGVAVNITPAFANNCYAVFLQENDNNVAGSAQAATHVELVSKSQFKIHNNSNGAQSFYWVAIGN